MGPGFARPSPGRRKSKNRLASPPRLAKQRLPGVLAVAGMSVLAFRKPDSLGGHSFQDIRMDCLKGEETLSLRRNTGRGRRLCRMPDPVQDCRRPRRGVNLINGLIAWPAQTGEDRI